MKLIDKSALVAKIKSIEYETNYEPFTDEILGKRKVCKDIKDFLDTLEAKEIQEKPVSEDLEEAARKIATRHSHITGDTYYANDAWFFKKGAQWQKEQMEKNRIAHCDNITEEQYNLETGFLDGFLDKNKRMPTFLDAIEYGMKKAMEE